MPVTNVAAEALTEHFERMLGRQSPRSEFVDILRKTRILLEQNGTAKAQGNEVLSLYCNWLQHSRLDRSPWWNILETLNNAIIGHGDSDIEAFSTAVSSALSLTELRKQMRSLYVLEGIRTDILDSYSNWNLGFLGAMFDELCNVPIEFPQDIDTNPKARGRVVYDKMIRDRAAYDRSVHGKAILELAGLPFVPRALFISREPTNNADPTARPRMFWNIVIITQPQTATIRGELLFLENRTDFQHD